MCLQIIVKGNVSKVGLNLDVFLMERLIVQGSVKVKPEGEALIFRQRCSSSCE